MKHTRKRAQMEAAGLVVIVILITLGLLFMTKFALQEKKKEGKVTVQRELLAQSTLSAILKTTAAEAGEFGEQGCIPQAGGNSPSGSLPRLGKDILEDCAQYYDTRPGGYSRYRCNQQHSCIFLREQVEELLEQTLGKWNINYDLNVSLLEPFGVVALLDPPVRRGIGCPATKARDSSDAFPLSTEVGTVESVLYLC
ncbi:MAG: hypothetical protein AABX13_01220 [Nanoarchaeota archaeon]